MNDWQARLRLAIERSGKKHSVIAREAGIAPETLSRILNDPNASPLVGTFMSIVRAADESIGWVLGESGYDFSWYELRRMREVAARIVVLTDEVLTQDPKRRK